MNATLACADASGMSQALLKSKHGRARPSRTAAPGPGSEFRGLEQSLRITAAGASGALAWRRVFGFLYLGTGSIPPFPCLTQNGVPIVLMVLEPLARTPDVPERQLHFGLN